MRSSSIPTVSGPTRLRLPDLLRITDQAADAVLRGRYNHLLPSGDIPTQERRFTRLHSDDEVDVWLISWVPDHATELHDHGGLLGALTLLSGALDVFRWDGNGLRRRRLDAGDQAGFPLGWVHDVAWAPAEQASALSVHAYSPPLTAMSYYEVTEHNTLRRVRTGLADAPAGHMTSRINEKLHVARARLRRLHAREVPAAVRRGAVLLDIRPESQRETEGAVPGALVIERNVLEWRCDPTSEARLPQAVDDDVEWVVLCSQGYTSSLAAASLRDLGLHRATDVVGGYRSMAEAGVLEQLNAALLRSVWYPRHQHGEED